MFGGAGASTALAVLAVLAVFCEHCEEVDSGQDLEVSSFANASGGYLVYGVEEESGIPNETCGLSVSNTDAQWLRLQSMILDAIDPRIPGVDRQFVPVADSKHVLVIRIPKSWDPPHMVTFQGTNKFYGRNTAGKYLLDVAELRSQFAMSSSLTEQIKKFRVDRVSRIIADETPVALGAVPRIVLHIVPLQAFSSTSRVDLALAAQQVALLYPLGAQGFDHRFNLDGLLHWTTGSLRRTGSDAYLELYHNGIIETVDAAILSANAREIGIPSTLFEAKLMTHVPQYLTALKQLGISPPFVVMLSLSGVKGHTVAVTPKLTFRRDAAQIDRDILIIPEVVLQGFECTPADLRPMLDSVWNAAGWQQSPNFDAAGNYRPQ